MNFEEAIKKMKDGHKCKTKAMDFCYYKIINNEIVCYNSLDNSEHTNQHIRLKYEIEATDWEILEEDNDWNLAKTEKIIGKTSYGFDYSDIVKCRDLILQDLGKIESTIKLNEQMNIIINKRFGKLE